MYGGECTTQLMGVNSYDDWINEQYEEHTMLNLRLARPMLIALAACAANCLVQGSALADDAQENQALKEQMRQMM